MQALYALPCFTHLTSCAVSHARCVHELPCFSSIGFSGVLVFSSVHFTKISNTTKRHGWNPFSQGTCSEGILVPERYASSYVGRPHSFHCCVTQHRLVWCVLTYLLLSVAPPSSLLCLMGAWLQGRQACSLTPPSSFPWQFGLFRPRTLLSSPPPTPSISFPYRHSAKLLEAFCERQVTRHPLAGSPPRCCVLGS